jgi:Zn-finger nucleic acid-binding protein
MDCPVDDSALSRAELMDGLSAFQCGKCRGHWLRFGDYLSWRESQPGDVPEAPAEEADQLALEQPAGARFCPDCKYLLTRFDIGRGLRFTLDRCGKCNGVWLDHPEWELLRKRGLHDNLHQMFGPGWQFSARNEERRRRQEASFERRLGADFERTKAFAEWVENHPRRSEILAFIQSRIR